MKSGRSDLCSCGSGKKYKHCCESKAISPASGPSPDEFNQLVALFNAKCFGEMETRTRALIARFPDSGFAWKLLGTALQMQGKNALTAFQMTAELMPADPEVFFNLGVVQKNLGLLDDAVTSYCNVLKLKPDSTETHFNLGAVLNSLGRFEDALTCYRRALKLRPDAAKVHFGLGNTLKSLGQLDDAVTSYQQALQFKPDYAEAHNNLGLVLKELGQLDDAIVSIRRALEIKPGYAEAHYNLGNALQELRQFENAVDSYHRALEIKPDFFDAHNNLGNALQELQQFEYAVDSYHQALEIKPDFVDAYNNIGCTLNLVGQLNDAVVSFRKALEFDPDFSKAQSNLLSNLNYLSHSPEYCLEEARNYGRMVAKKVTSRFSSWQCESSPERLRVGMVSGKLCNAATGYFLESLLPHLDPARIELIAYPTTRKADTLTARIKPYFSAWKPLAGKNDETAAQLIHADGVHILMDLAGHSGHNRLPMFAWKPAPVQANWLDYFATTGVEEIDFLLADPVSVPETLRKYFTEAIWYLPDTRLCFSVPDVDLSVATLPALQNGHITFGCFQTLPKIGDNVLAAWGEIFTKMPNAKLRMQCMQFADQAQVELMTIRLQRYGIDPARVVLHGSVPRADYLAAHAEVDMILDTFPYPGGTTTCEALWMGVPTLTLAGDTLLSRQGASLLTAAGLGDWVATSVADYVDRAIRLSGNLPELAALRASLRQQATASPLFDAPRFAHNLEEALWGMWQARTRQLH